MSYSFGQVSSRRLSTCHKSLQMLMNKAIITSPVDFGVICGFRGMIAQNKAKAAGTSKARWGQSMHNFLQGDHPCSLAVDVLPFDSTIKDYVWDGDDPRVITVVEHIMAVAAKLNISVIWGGNYKKSWDKPHWELRL